MKKVYSSENSVMTGHVMALLEQAGIRCELRNRFLSGALGELPAFHCWPEVWIFHDEEYEQALALVEEVVREPHTTAPPWHCQCGETLEGQFTQCWHCGAQRPPVARS